MTVTATIARPASPFTEIPAAPPDPILGLTEAFQADPNPRKVNLGVGVYQDALGKVPLLKAVREAEARWIAQEDSKSYLPIDGAAIYNRQVQALLLGADSPQIAEGRVVTAQALGGTGALKIGADLLRRFFPNAEVWISDPSWENHSALFEAAGFVVKRYPYYHAQTRRLDFDGMMNTLQALPAFSIVVLHACCHNPTGVDLSQEQWRQLAALFQGRGLIPFLDFAYQGFGAGIEADAFAVRLFAAAGTPCLIAHSFSKSFSLYRERVGGLTILTSSADESRRVLSQLKRVIRTNYSSPASHGAHVAATVLAHAELRAQWEEELTSMRERINAMRHLFVQNLQAQGVDREFGFITQQKGMFSYSGLPVEAVHRLRQEYGIYIVDSGRICIAAMNENNIGYVCESIASVL